jgi:hypothetical protein
VIEQQHRAALRARTREVTRPLKAYSLMMD